MTTLATPVKTDDREILALDTLTGAEVLAASRKRLRPDPRTILLVVLVLNALVMSRCGVNVTLVVMALALVSLVLSRAYAWALAYLGWGIVLVLMVVVIPVLWVNGFTIFLLTVGYWMLKLHAAVGMSAYAIKNIVPGELTAGLRQLRVPIALTVPITVLLRFIPVSLREYQAVHEAMALRGLQMGWRALWHPLRYLEFILVPLLSSCARIADEMTAAGMVRGLGSKMRPRTLKRLRFNYLDLCWFIAVSGILAAAPALSQITFLTGGFK